MFAGKFSAGDKAQRTLQPGRHGWLHMVEDEIELGGLNLKSGDGAAISEETAVSFTAKSPTQLMLFDLN